MGRTEDIKQIFQDKDIVKKVKEWINSNVFRDEMNQASVAAATDSKLSLMEVLARLPVDEFEKMKQDLNLDFGLRSKSPAAMDGGFSSGPKGGLGSREVPPELNIGNEVQEECPHSIPVLERQINSAPERKSSDTRDQANTLAEFKTEQLTDHNKNYPPDNLDQSGLRSQGTTNVPSQHLSQVHGPTDSYRTTINTRRSQTRSRNKAQYALPGNSFNNLSPDTSDRHQVNGPQQAGNRMPTCQNAPPPGSQTATSFSHSAVGALQGSNVQQPHMSQIPSEALNTMVSMLERESRSDQTCASVMTENKNLRMSNRCLGQRFEQLQWKYVKLEQYVKTLEENLIQKDQDIEENKRVIRYFHTTMVNRKMEISELKKERDILRNKFTEELCQKLDEMVVKELEEKAQQKEQMKKQTEMMEEAYAKKVGAESELSELNDKTNVLVKENDSLKEENRQLKEELDVLRLRLQAQEEEKIKEREEINAIQKEFALREAQLKDRIDDEIQKLMQVYKDLKKYGEIHGLSLNLETERGCDDFPSP